MELLQSLYFPENAFAFPEAILSAEELAAFLKVDACFADNTADMSWDSRDVNIDERDFSKPSQINILTPVESGYIKKKSLVCQLLSKFSWLSRMAQLAVVEYTGSHTVEIVPMKWLSTEEDMCY